MQPVYADFQNLDDVNRLRLTCAGTRQDLNRLGIELRDGLTLTFYTDDADDEGRPENIAQAVLFFIDNDFVTGVTLPVDGGRTVFAPDSAG